MGFKTQNPNIMHNKWTWKMCKLWKMEEKIPFLP